MNRIRTKVVQELINTEQDFVKHLRDIVEVQETYSLQSYPTELSFTLEIQKSSSRNLKAADDTLNDSSFFPPQGYLLRCRSRPAMFSLEKIATIFGNVEHLYVFQKSFLTKLASCVNMQQPHASCVGECFLRFVSVLSINCEHSIHALPVQRHPIASASPAGPGFA